MSVNYRTVRGAELTSADVAAWRAIQSARAEFASPYFCAEFTLAVAAERRDVFVVILTEGGRAVGFFPFQRGAMGQGRPVGGPLSDFHGVIAEPGAAWEPESLLRAAGLSSWEFDHLILSQDRLSPFRTGEAPSPIMDLTGGYEAYMAGRRAEGTKQILKAEGLARKLEREVGAMRVVLDEQSPGVLAKVMEWKSEQCRASNLPDVFGSAWTRALMARLVATRGDEFSGMLSALYVGDELAAAHMGMRSRTVWHYWFPGYDEKFAKFSTGLLLLLRMAAAAPGLGITRIDLGKGESQYKQRLMNGASTVWEGRVERASFWTGVQRARRRAEAWSERSAIGRPLLLPLKAWRKIERERKFQ